MNLLIFWLRAINTDVSLRMERSQKRSHFSGKWTEEEERRLAEVVHDLTGTEAGDVVTQGVSWATVAELVGTRSEKQCRSKWLNYLNWKQSGGTEWTKEDDINLVRRYVRSPPSFIQISNK